MHEENNNRPSFASVVARGNARTGNVAMVTRGLISPAVDNGVRKQGVAFDAIENVPIEVYLEAISKVVPPNCATHISKVSRQIQVYFKSEMWAEKMILSGIDVQDYHLDIKPLTICPIKITISNVPPEISSNWLRNEIGKFGRVIGPMKTLFAATSRPEFAHIKSFRRTVLMEFDNDEGLDRMPKQLNFSLDGKPYSFYISVDVKCFKCGQMGHIRKSCPNSQLISFVDDFPEREIPNLESAEPTPSLSKDTQPKVTEDNLPPMDEEETDNSIEALLKAADAQVEKSKRERSLKDSNEKQQEQINKKKTKPLKRRSSPSTESAGTKIFATEDGQMAPPCNSPQATPSGSEYEYRTETESDTDSQCSDSVEPGLLDTFTVSSPLGIQELLNYLNEVKGSPRRLFFAKKYTSDINGLVSQLKSLSNYLKNNPIKSKTLSFARVKRVSVMLKEELSSCS